MVVDGKGCVSAKYAVVSYRCSLECLTTLEGSEPNSLKDSSNLLKSRSTECF